MVKELVEDFNYDEVELKGKNHADLVEELKVAKSESAPKELEEEKVEEVEVAYEFDVKLKIHQIVSYRTPLYAKRVKVTNMGGGDAFVGEGDVKFSDKFLLAPGESKMFEEAEVVIARSASRPTLNIKYLS